MNKQDFLNALQILRKESKQRNFKQTADMIIAFKNLDIKKPEANINIQVKLPHPTGKTAVRKLLFAKSKTFIDEVKPLFDKIILEEQIPKLKKKELNDVINNYDILYAEASLMIPIAKSLGQQLGPKGKMPSPVPPQKAQVEKLLASASSITRLSNRKAKVQSFITVTLGKETDSDSNLADNAINAFDAIQDALPLKSQNIKTTYIKFTMSPPIKVGEKAGEEK